MNPSIPAVVVEMEPGVKTEDDCEAANVPPQSPEMLLAGLASISIEPAGYMSLTFENSQVEQAFQARNTIPRIRCALICTLLFGTIHSVQGVLGLFPSLNDGHNSSHWTIPPIGWVLIGVTFLIFAAITQLNARSWELQHTKALAWSVFVVLLVCSRMLMYALQRYHLEDLSGKLNMQEAVNSGFTSGIFITFTILLMGRLVFPSYCLAAPCVYAIIFCASSVSSWYTVFYVVLILVVCLVLAHDSFHKERVSFTAEVKLRRFEATQRELMIQDAAARQRELVLQIEVQTAQTALDKAMQHAVYTRIGTSAVNHEAKRAISNTVTWMDEVESAVLPKIKALQKGTSDNALEVLTTLQTIITQVRIDNQDAFDGCKRVVMQQEIAAGTYCSKKEPFRIRAYFSDHLSKRKLIQVSIGDSVPECVMVDRSLFESLIRNLVHNAEVHGLRGGTIELRLDMAGCTMEITITNLAGENHAKCLLLQHEHGRNFLISKHTDLIARTQQIGSSHSTFLGMREIAEAGDHLEAHVDVRFEDKNVKTTVVFLNMQAAADTPSKAAKELGILDFPENILYIACDDDKAPRMMAKVLYKKVHAAEGSLILGEDMEGVARVPEIVAAMLPQFGSDRIICMFDENMHWEQGSIQGSQLCARLRELGFEGLVIIRSANDSDDSLRLYLEAGADALLGKGLKVKDMPSLVHGLMTTKRSGAKRGFELKAQLAKQGNPTSSIQQM